MVQNHFIEILLEVGLVGFVIFTALVVGFFRHTQRSKVLWAIAVALLAQWWFFSGYPNSLHVYIILILLYATYRPKQ